MSLRRIPQEHLQNQDVHVEEHHERNVSGGEDGHVCYVFDVCDETRR